MAIKKHDSSKRIQSVNSIQKNLENCLNVKEVPDSIREQITQLQAEISSLNFKSLNEPAFTLTGNISTAEEVLAIINELSDYNKWDVVNEALDKDELEWIKEHYNVDFNNADIKNYFISRPSKHRNEVSVVKVIALPQYFHVSYQTNSVGWSEDNLLTLKEFKSSIHGNVD